VSDNEESIGITIAGIDHVQNVLGREEPLSFFGDMIAERPELASKLGFWFDFIHEKKGEIPNIRHVTFDLLQRVLDEFVVSDSSNQNTKENEK